MDVAAEFYKARERKRKRDAYLHSNSSKEHFVPPMQKLRRKPREPKSGSKTSSKNMMHAPTWMESGFVKMPIALRWFVVRSEW